MTSSTQIVHPLLSVGARSMELRWRSALLQPFINHAINQATDGSSLRRFTSLQSDSIHAEQSMALLVSISLQRRGILSECGWAEAPLVALFVPFRLALTEIGFRFVFLCLLFYLSSPPAPSARDGCQRTLARGTPKRIPGRWPLRVISS